MKKRILSAVLTASLILSTQNIFDNIEYVHANDTIKIMSVGDSITDGYWETGGYRKYMYHALEENGITNIDMVGTKGSNEETYSDGNVTFTYDGNYSGYSGYAIQYMTGTETRQGILETMQSTNMMETYQPDIVLLQIGTNDVLSAYNDGITDRLENLCDYILSYLNEDDTLFVSTIPNIDTEEVYTWFWAYGEEYYSTSQEDFIVKIQNYVDTYNKSIQEMVQRKQSEGVSNIQFADINSVVDYQTDLYDGIHPNEQGYQKMGEYWCNTLINYLNGDNPTFTTTTATTEPITSEITTTETITDTVTTTELTTSEITTTETITDTVTTTEPTTSEITTTETITDTITTTEPTTSEITTIEPPIITYPKGDVNWDGKVTSMDLLLLKKAILNGYGELTIMEYNSSDNYEDYPPNYDINGDHNINSLDVIELKSILTNNAN